MGTHNWLGPEYNLKRLANGTHPSQIKKTCPHCLEKLVHRLLMDNGTVVDVGIKKSIIKMLH